LVQFGALISKNRNKAISPKFSGVLAQNHEWTQKVREMQNGTGNLSLCKVW